MASLKETPRQKMIGMMYLVLTALLALQVSDALLQKFSLLNSSLEIANQSASSKNKGVVQGIDERIKDLPNPAAYVDVLRRANDVRKLSDALVNHLDELKGKVLEAGGGIDPETGNIKNPKEEEKIYEIMVGGAKQGEAYKLIPLFDKYIKDILVAADPGTKFSSLALAGKDDPLTSKDANQSKKDFAELNFETTPVAAALATLSQKQSEVRRYEAEAIIYSHKHKKDYALKSSQEQIVFQCNYFSDTSDEYRKFRSNVQAIRVNNSNQRVVGWIRLEEARAVIQADDGHKDIEFGPIRFGNGGLVQYFSEDLDVAKKYRSTTRLLRKD